MTAVEAVVLSSTHLRDMRRAIIDTLPWHESEEDLRARAERWDLNSREVIMLEELDRIDYLMGAT